MPPLSSPVFVPDLLQALLIPEKGIVSKVLQSDETSKVVLYGLARGHEMKLHAAPDPAILYFLQGEAILTLGEQTIPVQMGAFAHMPAALKHAIVANTPVMVLLVILKGRTIASQGSGAD